MTPSLLPLCPSKTSPCLDSKRPLVCRQHAHMCFNMCACCRHTQGRFECIHGGVFKSTHGVFQRATPQRTHTPRPQRHNTTSHGDRDRERDRERKREKRRRKCRDKTRQEKTKEEKEIKMLLRAIFCGRGEGGDVGGWDGGREGGRVGGRERARYDDDDDDDAEVQHTSPHSTNQTDNKTSTSFDLYVCHHNSITPHSTIPQGCLFVFQKSNLCLLIPISTPALISRLSL